MEAGFYGDTDRVIGFFYEVKQRRGQLVPGWVTTVLDFVEDLVARYKFVTQHAKVLKKTSFELLRLAKL